MFYVMVLQELTSLFIIRPLHVSNQVQQISAVERMIRSHKA